MKAVRLATNPVISPDAHPSVGGRSAGSGRRREPRVSNGGENVNGPSLVRVPDWIEKPLGRYYLYFAGHSGEYIRLAFADSIDGPYRVHEPGTLRLEQTRFGGHIASPDVHVDGERREIRMYYHGCCRPEKPSQVTCCATSRDGLAFEDRGEFVGGSYWRVFAWRGWHYAIEMPGRLRRSRDPYAGFEEGPLLFPETQRHSAVMVRGETLHVFWSNRGDCPERIIHSRIDISGDWMGWRAGEPVTLLEPETEYEGARLPLEPSRGGRAPGRVRQLRDPCIYEEGGRTWLLYAIAGEHGIAVAKLVE